MIPGMSAATSITAIAQTREYRLQRQALVRKFIGRKPTLRESYALNNVALLLVRSELGAIDPAITPDELCKLNAAARRALTLLQEIAGERRNRRRLNPDARMPSFEGRIA